MIKAAHAPADVMAYDFRKPSRVSPERQRLLEATHEQLAQAMQGWVSGRLRAPFGVDLESVSQLVYSDFIGALPDAGAFFLYDVEGTPGAMALVSIDPQIAFVLIERLLGGGGVSDIPDRALTPLERVVMRIVTDRIVKELSSVWQDHVRLDVTWARSESAPELLEMAGRDDDVLVATLAVGVGQRSGTIRIALPFPVLESFFSRGPVRRAPSASVSAEDRASERRRVEALVLQASAVVSARLPAVRLPLRALSSLGPGDVLATGIPATSPVEVHVSGSRRFLAREGKLGPWVGVEITGPWKGKGPSPKANRLDLEMHHGE